MSKSKAVCCAFLFCVVVFSLWVSTFFIGNKTGWQPVSSAMSGILIGKWTKEFYCWLIKESK